MAADNKLELLITAKTDELRAELSKVQRDVDKLGKTTKESTESMGAGFRSALPDIGRFTIGIAAAGAAVGALSEAFSRATGFQDTLADLSAITGVTGAGLDDIGQKAMALSNTFGTTAAENVDAFKGVLSKLGPGIASNSEALALMGSHINTLAVASGLDATASMDALTTAMLQFGVDLSDPMAAAEKMGSMMNVMAAGAQQGAAEVPQIASALVVAGVSAKSAGVSFEETNAALQVLATGGLYGSEAGTALRNVFVKLQAPTSDAADMMKRFGIDAQSVAVTLTSKGLQAAVEELRGGFEKIQSPVDRAALLNKVFGESAQNAASILMDQSDAFKDLTVVMTGTNTATEQAKVKMDTFTMQAKILGEQVMNRLTSAFVSIAPALTSVVSAFADFLPVLIEYAPLVMSVVGAMIAYKTVTGAVGAAQKSLDGILNASPMKLYATLVAGALVSIKALADAMNETQAEALEEAKAQEQLILRKKESTQASLNQATETKRLADRYTELAGNVSRTKGEEEELQKTKVRLNEIYPGVINNTKDFGTQMRDIQGISKSAADQINKYKNELAGLDAQLVKSRRSQANTAVYAELEAVIDEVADANKNILNKATGAVLGTDTVKQQVQDFFAPLSAAIAKAFNETDLQKVEGQFASVIDRATQAGDIDNKTAVLAYKGMERVIAKRREYLALIQGAAEAQKQEQQAAATPPPPPAPAAKKEKKEKDKPIAGSLGELQAQLSALEAQMVNKMARGSEAFVAAGIKAEALRSEIWLIEQNMQSVAEMGVTLEDAMDAAFALADTKTFEEGFKESIESMTESVDEFSEALIKLSEEDMNRLPEAATRIWFNTKDSFDLIAGSASALGKGFGEMFTGQEDGIKEAMKSILGAIITSVEGMVLAAGAAAAAKGVLSWGFSSLSDIPLMAAAMIGLEAARAMVNSFEVGALNIPQNQLALVHQGEMIVPRTFAESIRAGDAALVGAGGGGNGFARKGPRQKPTPRMHISAFQSATNAAAWEDSRGVG